MKYFAVFLLLFASNKSFSQVLTVKDFETTLDTFQSHRITKEQLMNAKQLHTNFPWAHIKSFKVYLSSVGGFDVTQTSCNGDTLCPDLVNIYFTRLQPGTIVSFDPIVYNNQGKEIEWNGITFLIKDSVINTSP
jgi:hypothetical protein